MKKFTLLLLILFFMFFSKNLISQTIVFNDEVKGTWTKANSPYIVLRDITVPEDTMLAIEPGVEVQFATGYSMKVYGNLLAIGNENDKIIFTSTDTSLVKNDSTFGWTGIVILGENSDTSILENCIVEYVYINEEYNESKAAINIKNRHAVINKCRIQKNVGYYSGAIFCSEQAEALILNSVISENSGHYDRSGIYLSASNALIANNLISENGTGIMISGKNAGSDTIRIINNTIFRKTPGIYGRNIIEINNGLVNVKNCVVWGNTNTNSVIQLTSGYALFENCIIRYGESNILSDNCNTVFTNVYNVNPHFVDFNNENFQLTDSSFGINSGLILSPEIAAFVPDDIEGNPRIFDGDVDKIDIGAYEFQGNEIANRPPAINNPGAQHIFISSAREMTFNFSDADEANNHTLSVTTDNPNITLSALSAQENNAKYTIDPLPGWSGNANIFLSVADNLGAQDIDTFTLAVNDTVNYDISENSVWDIDTVFIGSSFKVKPNTTLEIQSGTCIRFLDNYSVEVEGILKALGSPGNKIKFTPADTVGFSANTHKGWGGIVLKNENDGSIFNNCIFEYVKDRCVFHVYANTSADIVNCIFRYNKALTDYNHPAVISGETSKLYIGNSLFYDNQSRYATVWIYDPEITLCNTVFFNNSAIFATLDLEDRGSAFIKNCIFWSNRNRDWEIKANYKADLELTNCILEKGESSVSFYGSTIKNMGFLYNVYPQFADSLNRDFHLPSASPCINKGIDDVQLTKLNNFDFDGNNRIFTGLESIPDIGAYEYQGDPANRQPVLEKAEDKRAMLGKPYTGRVNFYDADEGDTHTLFVTSNNINVSVQGLSGDTTGSVYSLVPAAGYTGDAIISVIVVDFEGLHDSISYILHVEPNACGYIYEDMQWDADTIHVVCDVIVEEGATLTINPGTKVIFDGPYMLDVYGTLKAEGAVNDTIRFILNDTITFNETVYANAWKGIKLNSTNELDTSELRYCEIRNSQAQGLFIGSNSTAVVSDCNIHHNIPKDDESGAGIYSYSKNSVIENCYIHHNQSNQTGGGIYLSGISKVINNIISDNTSRWQGGGIYSSRYNLPYSNIEGNTIQNNQSTDDGGGGIYAHYDTVRNNIIRNNHSQSGGGIMAYQECYIVNNMIENNTCGDTRSGGGLYLYAGNFNVSNNLITGNYAGGNGSAIYLSSVSGIVANNTICKNTTGSTGNGIYLSGDIAPEIINNIIWGNKSSVSNKQIHIGSQTSQPKISYCIVEGGKENISCSANVYYTNEYEYNTDIYPDFVDSANNDFNLTDSSICINSGIADTTGLKIAGTDIAHSARIYNGNVDRIDIGAYEFTGEPVNRKPVLYDMEDITLFPSQTKQMKVEYLDTDEGDTHTLLVESDVPDLTVENLSGQITGSTYNLVAAPGWQGLANIKIKVEDAGGLTDSIFYAVNVQDPVCGELTDNTTWDLDTVRVECNIKVPAGKTLTIMKGTVVVFEGYYNIEVNGNLIAEGTEQDSITFISRDKGSSVPDDLWGGIRFRKIIGQDTSKLKYCNIQYSSGIKIYHDNVIVSNCYFSHNTASNGGGVYVLNSSPLIENCTFANNSVSNTGGGISCIDEDDFDYIDTYPVIRGNHFTSNNASHGGAIYCSGYRTKPIITDNTFDYNHAWYGGALYLGDDVRDLILQNNLIFKNTASYDGAGIYFENYSQGLINNTIANNIANRKGGGLYFAGYSSGVFYNSIIYFNKAREAGSQVYLEDKSCDPNFYNCFMQYGSDSIAGGGAGNEYSGHFENVLSVDPGFADTANNNYQLCDSSFCINAGTLNIKYGQLPATDLAGNTRVFAGELTNVDVGAYEFQGNPKNRKPSIVPAKDQYTQISTPRIMRIYFTDADKTDVHTISVTSDNINVTVENKSGNTSGSTYELVPANGWEGIAQISVRVEDDKSNYAMDTFNLTVSENYCGSITENTVWSADTIKVSCSVTVEKDVTLTILPGTVILFNNYSSLNVSGRLLAVGTKDKRIIFTSSDTSAYPNENYTGWRGIRFYGPGSADTSRLQYCTVKYAKGRDMNYASDRSGGGLFFDDWNKALVSNCIICNNSAVESGGGIYFSGGGMYSSWSDVRFESNLISNNHANNGGGIYINIGNINPMTNHLVNNIICNNSATYGGGVYSNGMYSYNNTIANNLADYEGGGLYIVNNAAYVINSVLWGNTANSNHSSNQIDILYYNSLHLINNVIEDGLNGIDSQSAIEENEGLIEQNPEFVSQSQGAGINFNGLTANWSPRATSPCINKGTNDINIYTFVHSVNDITGEERILMDTMDIGPYEYRNYAPVKTGDIPDQQILADQECNINIPVGDIFTDMNIGDLPGYSFMAVDPAVWMSLTMNGEVLNISGTPAVNDAGNYRLVVIATDMFNEVAADTFTVTVMEPDPSDITDFTGNSLIIYPLPTKDVIYINYLSSEFKGCTIIEIYDLFGNLMMSETNNQQEIMKINMETFPAGIYYLNITRNNNTETYKIPKL